MRFAISLSSRRLSEMQYDGDLDGFRVLLDDLERTRSVLMLTVKQ